DDGYGEHADGSPFDGIGIGRGWPLLVGERAHYELAAGHRAAAERLRIAGVGDDGIRLREASQSGVVPASAVVVQPIFAAAAGETLLVVLTRVALGSDAAVRPAALAAEGIV